MSNLVSFNYTNLSGMFYQGTSLESGKIGDIINIIIPYVFYGTGIALLIILIMGGLSLMVSGGDPKKIQAAKGKITSGLIGFLIIFLAYWLVQLAYMILGIQPLFKVI